MPFSPNPNDQITIDGMVYRIAEHPSAAGQPYGQEGRAAVVYQLSGADGSVKALKVFKSAYRVPALVLQAEQIAGYAGMAGLRVCQRSVMTPGRHASLLRSHLDLLYAVLMPWIEGSTWQEMMLERHSLGTGEALATARGLAQVLQNMEERGLAHCDLSGSNLMLTAGSNAQVGVELVDVEGLYAPGLAQPETLPAGSPGYAHRTAPAGLWGSRADRFAGALLLAEMLGWCDPAVREAAWSESYFAPEEMQKECQRKAVLENSLRQRWGESIAGLFARAWSSATQAECPTLGDWLVSLPDEPVEIQAREQPKKPGKESDSDREVVKGLLAAGARLEQAGRLESAIEIYRQALGMSSPGIQVELRALIAEVERKRAASHSGDEAESLSVRERRCPECGRSIPAGMLVCPNCEGRKPEKLTTRRQRTNWLAPVLGILITIGVLLALVVEGAQGRGMLALIAKPTQTLQPTATPTVTVTKTPTYSQTITPTRFLSATPTFTVTPTHVLPSATITQTATRTAACDSFDGTWRGNKIFQVHRSSAGRDYTNSLSLTNLIVNISQKGCEIEGDVQISRYTYLIKGKASLVGFSIYYINSSNDPREESVSFFKADIGLNGTSNTLWVDNCDNYPDVCLYNFLYQIWK